MSETRKRALLVGIDHYPLWDAGYHLRGAIHDVDVLAEILRERFGFTDTSMEKLINDEATHDGILEALERLIERTDENDVVVIHFSGHGSWRDDPSEWEPDDREETLVPCDSGPGQRRDVGSHTLYDQMLRLTDKTQRVTLIFDCCHSGTITRDPTRARRRSLPPDSGRGGRRRPPFGRESGASGWLPLSRNYTLFAACRSDETAHEVTLNGRPHGALTCFLSRELSQVGPESTYRDVFERAAQLVRQNFPSQHPQLEGAGDRKIFELEEVAPYYLVNVTERRGRRVTLAAGTVHGVAEDSEWGIYPQGTKQPQRADRLGTVRVTAAQAVISDAEILETPPAAGIGPLCRVHEEVRGTGEIRLGMAIGTTERLPHEAIDWANRLRDQIDRSCFLRLLPASEAQVIVHVLAARSETRPSDPAPALRNLEAPACVVVGRDGEVILPVYRVDDEQSRIRVAGNLERWARLVHLRNLGSPAESPLTGLVTLRLLRRDRAGCWNPAAVSAGSEIVFHHGEPFALEITQRSGRPLFVHVLDLGAGGGIGVLHPMEGAWEPLPSDKTVTVGQRRGQGLRFFIPGPIRELPRWSISDEERPVCEATETLKLFATVDPTDFRPLYQGGYRQIPSWEKRFQESDLGRLLTRMLAAHHLRELRSATSPVTSEWMTSTIDVTLVGSPRSSEMP